MFGLPRTQLLSVAAAGVLVTLTVGSTPVRANEVAQNLGPVGPYEPILTTVGGKRVIAFYVRGGLRYRRSGLGFGKRDADTAARIRVSLNPGHVIHIDSAESKSITLECGDFAKALSVIR
jgi:hypothetical protein